MKGIIIGLLLLFGLQITSFGQFRFGVKIDPQISWFNIIGDISEPADNNIGVNVGLMADKYFTENYAVSFGASLNNTGSTITYKDDQTFELNDEDKTLSADEPLALNIQYLQLPLGLKFLSKSIGYIQIYADLGADGYFRIRSLASSGDAFSRNDAKKETQIFNLGYHFGGGIEYSLGGNTSIVTGITYSSGLIDVVKNKDDNVNINTIALRLGIMF